MNVDKMKRHEIPRHKVQNIICSLCDTEQEVNYFLVEYTIILFTSITHFNMYKCSPFERKFMCTMFNGSFRLIVFLVGEASVY
jgi:hypothetical protein